MCIAHAEHAMVVQMCCLCAEVRSSCDGGLSRACVAPMGTGMALKSVLAPRHKTGFDGTQMGFDGTQMGFDGAQMGSQVKQDGRLTGAGGSCALRTAARLSVLAFFSSFLASSYAATAGCTASLIASLRLASASYASFLPLCIAIHSCRVGRSQ